MVISVKETWHKLLFNHTALDAQTEQVCPKRAPLQMTSPQDFLSAFFFFFSVVVLTKQAKGWIFQRSVSKSIILKS